ncbi:ribosomal-protein-alanine N-acetyltransferase [Lactiplantibacillus pentosus]|jgi:ribosomal-protein-alanine N-acetyltransferase|uniref:ribosomal protein S18-alanine N-acetyltransferase n=1 Tax=Lactiplantibacillus pentosus TaxID=1589 RepID=UPI001CFFFA93|nr:ribosomal protein S18-alanine N-acetyltransferase [Lactiplantibacillus pentosus]MCB5222096.1 ribosomal protein S18-alanine N-acetyltransferase [Lactiplantibacillus pentosus]MCT0162464.1 ribosomal-protein-alanine N-acetyltransferase [Lactiplantibacillus pentosus]MCT3288979.1 ribosomal-protein-alanine N-acetyltransferase [Lactiplantibacillus pentosus]
MTERQLVTASDLPAEQVAQICYQLATKAYAQGSPWRQATFASDVALPTAHYALLRWQGAFVGFISRSTVLDETEVTNVAIDPAYQRQGHARWLLTQCLAQLSAGTVFLEVRAHNIAAQRLYQQVGFEQIATRKAYYQDPDEDAWIMRKIID